MSVLSITSRPAIASIAVEPFEIALHSPFVTSRGAATAARGVAVMLTLDDGRTARGESVPVTYVTGETLDTVVATLQRVGAALIGREPARHAPLLAEIARLTPGEPSARCGLEMAALEARTLVTGESLWTLWGGTTQEIHSDLTIPIVPNAGELAEIAWALGMRVFKIKVGEVDVEADHARVRAVREAAPEARLRIDANQAFTPGDALAFIERLVTEGAQIELLEQPVHRDDFEGLAEVARRSPVPVFADESCCTPQDALRLAGTPVHGYNLKINKCGIVGVHDIVAIARAAGKRLMLGCMLETRRSIAVSLALACGTGAFDFLDLDSHLLLNESGDNPYFLQEGARMMLLP
jgi:L-alanine-DL-glutamate epimerase-like enolase superfamily enzyme